jgi:broad specificity phosphatase PhoE
VRALRRIPLTSTGRSQAREAGKRIREIIGNESLYVYVSPYVRTRQTMDHVLEAMAPGQVVVVREEPRISEQQVRVG